MVQPTSAVSSSSKGEQPLSSPARIGIIGGGQLGRMLTQAAKKLGFVVVVLDPTPNAPAGQVADAQIVGGFADPTSLRQLVQQCDVTTYDIEHIDTAVLQELAAQGHAIHPDPAVLEVIQDKLLQKERLAAHGIPVPHFAPMHRPSADALAAFGYPLVQKARRGGYDGRGVVVLHGPQDVERALSCPSILEPKVDIAKELAVMVARDHGGGVRCFPVVEMVFDARANILDMLLAPARIDDALTRDAQAIAAQAVEALGGVGIFGVELFLTQDGSILVNEIAPRPHNSGHYTIEACVTSQFEQHLRAVSGLPLGSTQLMLPAATLNLLGNERRELPLHIESFRELLAIDGVSVHLYGKSQIRPFRKMGHVTIVADDTQQVLHKAAQVRQALRHHQGVS